MGRKVVRLSLVLALMGALLALGPIPAAVAQTAGSSGPLTVIESIGIAQYTVTLTGAPSGDVSIGYTTADGTAKAGSDYVAASGTLVFPAAGSQTVDVTITNDLDDEIDETFLFKITSVTGGGASPTLPPDVTTTITDNDPMPIFSIDSKSGDEGTGITFTVAKTGATALPTSVKYATVDGTAAAPGDYTAIPLTTLDFAPADTTKTFTVTTVEDTVDEADEIFTVPLSAPTNAAVAVGPTGTGTGTIIDDEAPPGLSVATAAPVAEGQPLKFTVTLAPASGQPVTVKYKTVDGTAKAPGDYTALPLATLTFGIGETTKVVEVATKSDTVDEISETVSLELSAPTVSTIAPGAGTATGTITDDPADNKPPVIDKLLITDAAGVPKTTFNRGETTKVNIEFTDPGVADSHEVIVSWQDGTDDFFTMIPGTGSAKRTFAASHKYTDIAPQTITVIVNDGEGGQDRKDAVTIFITGAGGAGLETVGLVDPGAGFWNLRNSGGDVTSFFYGNPGDFPIIGDWDCDGDETPGMYRQSDGFVYLRNSNTQGVADIKFFFGDPGDIPIVGDFNGDGCHTVSIYRPSLSRVFVINKLGENNGGLGEAELSYFFGNPGDKPFVGDFDGDGKETIGLHRESTGLVYFRNTHTQGVADNEFIFGDPGDRIVGGDWTQIGIDSPAVFRPGSTTFFFRHSNTQGVADNQFVFGEAPYLPVAGDFGLG